MICEGEGVAEVAAVAVRTGAAGENHAAGFGLVAGVAEDGAELSDAVGELAMVAVGALPALLPLVAQLRFEHPLMVHLQLQSSSSIAALPLFFAVFPSSSCPFLPVAVPAHVHPLLLFSKQTKGKLTCCESIKQNNNLAVTISKSPKQ